MCILLPHNYVIGEAKICWKPTRWQGLWQAFWFIFLLIHCAGYYYDYYCHLRRENLSWENATLRPAYRKSVRWFLGWWLMWRAQPTMGSATSRQVILVWIKKAGWASLGEQANKPTPLWPLLLFLSWISALTSLLHGKCKLKKPSQLNVGFGCGVLLQQQEANFLRHLFFIIALGDVFLLRSIMINQWRQWRVNISGPCHDFPRLL